MAWYEDLRPCDYFQDQSEHGNKVIAVGWLERGHPCHKGEVAEEVIKKLIELLTRPWRPVGLLGWHPCDFCRVSNGPKQLTYRQERNDPKTTISLGTTNLFIPADGFLYASPSLMLHYIDAHEYAPPAQFCAAVLACPPMGSEDYLQAIAANGPAEFARWARETPRKIQ